MFDGNHRTRRTVDLSGRSNRRRGHTSGLSSLTAKRAGTSNREALVEQARLEREKRHLAAKREKSAKLIQRHVRGYQSRQWIALVLLQKQQQQHHALKSLVLSMKLSNPIAPFYKPRKSRTTIKGTTTADTTTTIAQALVEYYNALIKTNTNELQLMSNVSQQRIIRATLQHLRPPSSSTTTKACQQEKKRINLQLFELCQILLNTTLQKQHQHQQKGPYFSSTVWNLILMDLVTCCQEWISYNATLEISKHLWQYSCQFAFQIMSSSETTTNHTNTGLALLAGTIFGAKSKLFVKEDTSLYYMNTLQEHYYSKSSSTSFPTMNNNEWYQTYLIPCLVQVLKGKDTIANGSYLSHDTVSNMIDGRECILLNNALDIWDSSYPKNSITTTATFKSAASATVSMIDLIHVVLQRRSIDLGVLASVVIRGQDNIQSLVASDDDQDKNTSNRNRSNISSSVAALHVDEQSDDDYGYDDLEEEHSKGTDAMDVEPTPASASSAAAVTSPAISSRPKRHKKSKKHKQPRGGGGLGFGTFTKKKSSSKYSYYSKRTVFTRQELLTVPKLDRLYQNHVFQLRKATLDKFQSQQLQSTTTKKQQQQALYDPLVVNIAIRLAEPHRWIQWSNHLFVCVDNNNNNQNDTVLQSAKTTYASILYTMLQCSTGLRTAPAGVGVQSEFVSQLAFHSTLVEGLWTFTLQLLHLQGQHQQKGTTLMSKQQQQQLEYKQQELFILRSLSVFSDLFAYHLLAVNDEEFLSQYTLVHQHETRNQSPSIVAEDLIGRLRHILYGLYWIKPVVVTDVGISTEVVSPSSAPSSQNIGSSNLETQLSQHRARLMLSGTKLWNSLYERWCRLVRYQSFTKDESSWWFPHLMTKDDTSAVNANASGTQIMPDDDDSESDHHYDEDQMNSNDSDSDSDSDDDHPSDVHNGDSGRSDSDDEHNGRERTVAEQESDALSEAFKDPKMARILTCIPQALPFDRRVRLFSSLLHHDRLRTQDEESEFRHMIREMAETGNFDFGSGGRVRVQINRNNIYGDSMRALNSLGSRLKKKVKITFVNQHGAVEPGIDGGGVFKEFLDDLIKEAFYPDKEQGSTVPKLFGVTPLQTLAVDTSRPALLTQEQHQMLYQNYEFLGRVLGKAVYESILVEPQFCLPFLNKLLGKQNTLDDLKNYDAELYKHLISCRDMNSEEIAAMGLHFEWTFGKESSLRTVELIRGGSSFTVTKQNVTQYVNLVAHQHLNVQGAMETKVFLRGFRDLIPASWVRLFSGYELQKLISGDDAVQGIDVAGLKAVMQYAGGYHPDQPIMKWFWEVLEEITPEQQGKFLRFMTSCSRQPLLGFQSLAPAPCVQQIRLPDHLFNADQIKDIGKNTNLPTSSTCMNLLKLPNYRNKQLLKLRLLYAIESGAGFELT